MAEQDDWAPVAQPAADDWAPVSAAPRAPTPQQRAVVSANDNAEDAAKAMQVGRKLNVPPVLAASDLPGYTEKQRTQSAINAVQNNPAIARYVDGNPMASKVSGDDYDHLDEVSSTMRSLGLDRVNGKASVGVLQAVPEIAGLTQTAAGRDRLWQSLKQLPGGLVQGVREFIETAGKVYSGEVNLNEPQGLDAGISMGIGIALGGAGRRGTIVSGPPKGLEGVPGPGLAGNVEAILREQRPVQSFDDFMGTLRGMKTRQEIDDFIASKTPGPPGAMLQITKAGTAADALGKAVEQAQDSRTKQRSPELFTEFGAAHDIGDVHISGQKLLELYEKEGKAPAEGDGLFGFVPDIATKIQDAAITGSEVTIPTAQYVAHVDLTVHEGLKESVRLHDDGVTLEEAKEVQKEIEAWHGTPHDFERFDLTKIGTGEGAQVYGHGLYFAENRKVSEGYAEKLAATTVGGEPYAPETNPLHALIELSGEGKWTGTFIKSRADYIKMLEGDIADMKAANLPGDKGRVDFYQKQLDILKSGKEIPAFDENKGHLLKVSINADPTKFLDWDVPFAEQTPHVQEVLRKLGYDETVATSGQDVYQQLARANTKYGAPNELGFRESLGPVEASRLLAEAGIPGIKYLDQGSRRAPYEVVHKGLTGVDRFDFQTKAEAQKFIDEHVQEHADEWLSDDEIRKNFTINKVDQTRNFVVFDERLVKITEKNGNAVVAAVQEAVEQDKKSLYLHDMFKNAKSLGITEPEFKRYSDLIQKREDYILERAINTNRDQIKRTVSAEWKRNEAAVREEVVNTLTNTGRYAVAEFQQRNKINIDPSNADDLAPLFGYETGQELLAGVDAVNIRKATTGKNWRTQLKDDINTQTKQVMEERYGRLQENISREAIDIALAHHTFDILAEEVRILAKLGGGEPAFTKEGLVEWAQQSFERGIASEAVNFNRASRAVAKNGRDAEKALLKGDYVEALQAKQRQFASAVIAKESLKLAKRFDQVQGKIEQFTAEQVIPSIDQRYLDHIRELLDTVGVEQTHAPLTDVTSVEQFVSQSNQQIAVAPWLFERRVPKLNEMTVAQFREFADSLQSMEHAGRDAQKMYSAHGQATLEDVVRDVIAQQARFPKIDQRENPTISGMLQRAGRYVTAVHLLVERVLDYSDQYDPNGPLTTYVDRPLRAGNNKEIELTEQVSKKIRALGEFTDRSVTEKVPNKVIPDPRSSDGFYNMDRRNLRQLALYMGSRENVAKVAEGMGVNEADVRKYLDDNMTKNDWKFVEGMWDIYEDLYKEASEMILRDTGVPLKKKTNAPIETPFGTVSGGYAPLVYDRKRSNIEGTIRQGDNLFDPEYFTAMTSHGYAEPLTAFKGFLDLTGHLTESRIKLMIHDIAFREPVRQVAKLINNEMFMQDMIDKWGAEVAGLLPGWIQDIANPRNVDDAYAMHAERWAAAVRQNITSTLIAINLSTIIKHGGTAAAMSAHRVGAGALGEAFYDIGAKAMWENAKDLVMSTDKRPTAEAVQALKDLTEPSERGEQTRQFILAKSPMMRSRQRQAWDTIRGSWEYASEGGTMQNVKDARLYIMQLGRAGVALSDTLSAQSTWLAAYEKAMMDHGDDAQAAFQADKEVTRAHGSSFIGDRPRVLRTGELMRWVTPLYGFWNHMANNYFQAAWDAAAIKRGEMKYEGPMIDAGGGGPPEPPPVAKQFLEQGDDGNWYYSPEPSANWKAFATFTFFLLALPIIFEHLANPPKDEHEDRFPGEGILNSLAAHFGSSFVGVRDVSNAIFKGTDPSIGLIGTLLQQVDKARKDAKAMAASRRARNGIANSMTMLGFATGFGSSSLGKMFQFGVDVGKGIDRPGDITTLQGFTDYYQGIRTGHSKARKFK